MQNTALKVAIITTSVQRKRAQTPIGAEMLHAPKQAADTEAFPLAEPCRALLASASVHSARSRMQQCGYARTLPSRPHLLDCCCCRSSLARMEMLDNCDSDGDDECDGLIQS
jgi:hypothetical protein